ncbi:hypothetical protein [Streptomyces monashensis]|uniref:Uncharacterized protein n=1 Tax=Streptomyces monashensis TaxID=1678012 RepID=A0A1S2PDE8_9ACTN|nr:hypothetical protein [Streptomyces monashensis]OIJ91869.1 hypothetical protein BIV23_39445 [Streptomyces monashensis]
MNAIRRAIAAIASAAFLALGCVTSATPAQAQVLGTSAPSDGPLDDVESDVTSLIGAPLSL